MQLPLKLPMDQMQTRWKAILDPLLANNLNNISILPPIQLINGVTVVNHLLDRIQQGWIQLDIDAAATYYRSQPFNNKTITFTSNAAATIVIGVY